MNTYKPTHPITIAIQHAINDPLTELCTPSLFDCDTWVYDMWNNVAHMPDFDGVPLISRYQQTHIMRMLRFAYMHDAIFNDDVLTWPDVYAMIDTIAYTYDECDDSDHRMTITV